MTPNIDDRLASVIRALTDVVLPALPPDAGLAQEQVHLTLGHLQILRAQLDRSVAFEATELADARALAEELASLSGSDALAEPIAAAARAETPGDIRAARVGLHAAIHELAPQAARHPAMFTAILTSEKKRVAVERAWFAPFGFDAAPADA